MAGGKDSAYMYLFSRIVTYAGDPRTVRPQAVGLAQYVTEKTELQISLWSALGGQPLGTMAYTSFVQSRAELDAALSSLANDSEYLDRVTESRKHAVAPPQDQLLEILHSAGGEYRRAGVGHVATVITAQVANARFGPAVKWGIEMADLASEITGVAGIFGRGVVGPFGTVSWISAVPDMAAVDAANEALAKDPRYLAKLDDMADVFLPGSGNQTLTRRLA